MAGDPCILRTYEPGDETAILELFGRCFHQRRSLEHWFWKYRDNPYGNGRICLALDGEEALAAHYAGYPVPFRYGDADLTAHQIGDTMTRPDMRHVGRGPTSLLARTARCFYEHFCAGRVAFNYGFNVSNIQKFSLRFLNAHRVEPVGFRVRRLSEPLPGGGTLGNLVAGREVEDVESVGGEWDELFEEAAPHYRFLVRRDAGYLRWRYLERPDFTYRVLALRRRGRLAGWGVFARRGEALVWGDALFHPRCDARDVGCLLGVAASRSEGDGAERVQGWFPPRPGWFSALLDELGFRYAPEPQGLSLMCVPFERPEAPAEMARDLYYTWGDSDLF